jgi:TnpA family transposase
MYFALNAIVGNHERHLAALSHLILGSTRKRFAPRLRNLKSRSFHTIERADTYPALKRHIGVTILRSGTASDDALRCGKE